MWLRRTVLVSAAFVMVSAAPASSAEWTTPAFATNSDLGRLFGPDSLPNGFSLQVAPTSPAAVLPADHRIGMAGYDAVLRPHALSTTPAPIVAQVIEPAVLAEPAAPVAYHAERLLGIGAIVVALLLGLRLHRRLVGLVDRRSLPGWLVQPVQAYVTWSERPLRECREVGAVFSLIGRTVARAVIAGGAVILRQAIRRGRRLNRATRNFVSDVQTAYGRAATVRSGLAHAASAVLAPVRSHLAALAGRRRHYIAKSLRLGVTFCAVVAVALPPVPVQLLAAEWYWDPDSTATGNDSSTGAGLGGSGTWNLSSNRWWNGSSLLSDDVWPNGADDVAVFFGSAGTVTLSENVQANGLKFKSSGYFLTGSTIALAGTTPTITVDSTYSATINSTLDGTAGFTKAGTGTLTLSGTNLYTGTTVINGGTLVVSANANLGDAANDISFTGNGALTISGAGFSMARSISIADNVAATINLAPASGSHTTTLSGSITGGNSGSLVLSGGIYGGQNAATLELTGAASSYTAATTINNGVTLRLSGSTAALTGTPSITLNGGSLTLVNVNSTEAALNRIKDDAPITSNGGAITFTNTASNSISYAELIGAVALTSGRLVISNTTINTSPSSQVLALSGLTRTGSTNTSTVTFSGGTSLGVNNQNRINIAGQGAGDIGPWATILSGTTLRFAAYDTTPTGVTVNGIAINNGVVAAATTPLPAGGAGTDSTNYLMTANTTITSSPALINPSYKTLVISSGTAATLALAGNTVSVGGIATTGANHIISGAGALQPLVDGAPLFLHVNANQLSIGSTIQNKAAASAVVVSGNGTLVLNNTVPNTFSGGLVINSGTVSVANDGNLGAAAGSVTFNGNATLTTTAATNLLNRTINLNNGAIANFNYLTTAVPTLSGKITGTGGLAFTGTTGAPIVALSSTSATNGANDFWGPLRISGTSTSTPILAVASLLDSSSANGAIRLGGAGTAAISATFQWSAAANSPLILNHRQFDIASTGASGGGVAIESANASTSNTITVNTDLLVSATTAGRMLNLIGSNTGANAFNGRIANGAVPISVTHSGSGTWILAGNNSYSGGTTLSRTGITGVGSDSAFGTGTVTISGAGGALQAIGGARTISNAIVLTAATPFMVVNGTNSLTLAGNFTNSGAGRTLTSNISGGTLTIGSATGSIYLSEAQATGRVLTINGTGTTVIAGVIADSAAGNSATPATSGLTVNMTGGSLTLANVNTYTGSTTLTAGTLVLGTKSPFGASTVAWNGVNVSASTPLTGANAIANTSTLGGVNVFNGTNSIQLSGVYTLTADRTVTNNMTAGSLTFSNTIELSSSSNVRTLTLNGSGNTTISGPITNGAATNGNLIYSGTGTLTLANANTYGGNTTISSGTVKLDFAAATAPASDIIYSNSPLSIGAAVLTIQGSTGTPNSQAFASTALTAGTTTINATAGAAGLSVNLNALTRANGAVLNVNRSGASTVTWSGVATTNDVFIDANGVAFVTINGTDWAGNAGLVAPTYATNLFTTAASNVDVTNAVAVQTTPFTINTLRFNTAAATTLTLGPGTNTLSAGGLLIGSGAGAVTIGGTDTGAGLSFLRGTLATSRELNIIQNSATPATISAAIIDSVVNKYGSGTLILSSKNNRYNGATNILTGTLRLGDDEVLPNGAYGAQPVNVASGATLDLNGMSETINALTGAGTVDNSSTTQAALTIGDGNGAGTFSGTFANTGGAAAYSITKIGSGAQTFNNPGTVTRTAATGTPLGTGNVVLTGGSIALAPTGTFAGLNSNFSGANAAAGSTFTYNGGGTLTLTKGTATSMTYTVGNTGTSGSALVRSGNGTLVLAPTALANLGVSENFVVNGLTNAANTNGIYNPSVVAAIANVADFVQYGNGASIGFGSAASVYTALTGAVTTGANQIGNVTGTATITDTGNHLYALRVGAFTATLNGTVTINGSGGQAGVILNAATSVITGGTLDFGTSEAVIYTAAAGATINSPITGSGGITKFGPGSLILGSNASSFAGTLQINQGVVSIAAADRLGNATQVTLAGTGQLTATAAIAAGSPITQTIHVAPGAFSQINGATTNALTVSGPLTGSGSLTITGGTSGVATFGNSNNTFSGTLFIGTGSAQIAAFASLGNSTVNPIALGGAANTGTFAYIGSAPLTLNRPIDLNGAGGGGVIDASGTDTAATLTLNGAFTASGSGAKTFTLTGSNAGDNTFAGNIVNSTVGAVSLIKAGAGTWVLTGANTFTGATTIQNGTLSVSTLNSVAGGDATSTLGAPTTVANGTISIGSAALTGTLLYTGSGETTDRIINLAGTSGGATLDQSGAGVLKFISAFTATGGGDKTLTLQGSTTGTGEIAAAIVDNTASNQTALVKNGTGTWTLSGSNTYTGTTTINAGTLNLSGSLAVTAITINGGVLKLSGTGSLGTANALNLAGGQLDLNGINASAGVVTISAAAPSGDTIKGPGMLTGTSFVSSNPVSTTVTISAALAGASATLNKTGAGVLELTGANTYGGVTTIAAGTLNLTGSLDNTAITVGAATFNVDGAAANALTGTAALTINNAAAVVNINSAVNYSGGTTLSAGTLNLSGSISGSTVTVSGTGMLNLLAANALTGSAGLTYNIAAGTQIIGFANNHTGNTTLTTGTLRLTDPNAIQNSPFKFNGGVLQLRADSSQTFATAGSTTGGAALTINVDRASGAFVGNTLTLGGDFTIGGAHTVNVTGNNGYSLELGATSISGNTVFAPSTANLSIDSLNATGSFTLTLGGTIATGTNTIGAITGISGLTKSTAATWNLNGANVYTGATTVSGGTLNLSGSISGSTVTVSGTGVLNLLAENALTGSTALIYNVTAGTQTLAFANNHTGDTTTTGTLVLAHPDAVKNSTLKLNMTAGTLRLRSDDDDTFATNGTTMGATAYTINVDRLSDSATNKKLTLGGTLTTNTIALTITGDHDYSLGLGAMTITGNGTFNPNSANVSIASVAGTGTLTLAGTLATGENSIGAISGVTTITKNSAATWNLTGAVTNSGATNLSAGTTNVTGSFGNTAIALSNGTLNLNATNAFSTNTLTMTATSTLTTNATNALTGNAALTITLNTLATLASANDFNGNTTLTAGTLRLSNFLAIENSPLKLNGGTLQLRHDSTGTFATGGITVGGTTTINVDQATAGITDKQLTLGGALSIGTFTLNVTGANNYGLGLGAVSLTGNAIFNPTTANLAVDSAGGTGNLTLGGTATNNTVGAISVTGNLVKNGIGTWTLTDIGSYSGTTAIQVGTLNLTAPNVIPSGSAVSVVTSSAGAIATLILNGNNQTFFSLSLGGATGTSATSQSIVNIGSGTLTLGGDVAFTATGNPQGSQILGGTLSLGSLSRTFNIADSTTASVDLEITSVITETATAGIIKSGAGALLLSANNTFTGDVVVNAGTLSLTGTNAFAGDITVNAGTLQFRTVSNLGGPANSLGSSTNSILMNGGTLSFVGDVSQTTNRGITTMNSISLGANGTNGAVITYTAPITFMGPDANPTRATVTLNGTGTGVLTGGMSQPPTEQANSDLIVHSGTWTLSDSPWVIEDDLLVGKVPNIAATTLAVLNLNTTGIISFLDPGPTPTWPGAISTAANNGFFINNGGTVNLGADDVIGSGLDYLYLGLDYQGVSVTEGILNTNTYRITTPILGLGDVDVDAANAITGSGTVIVTDVLDLVQGSISANLSGAAAVTKRGVRNVTLSGDNSGLTATVFNLNEGGLTLDYTSSNAPKLPSGMTIVMGGATLTVQGGTGAAATQTIAGLTLNDGQINQVIAISGTGQSMTLNLGAISRPTGGGVVRFTLPINGNITTTTQNTFGILGSYATVVDMTGTYFARNDGAGNIVPLTYGAAQNDVTAWQTGDHITDGGGGFVGSLLGGISISSLRFDAASGSTLDVGAGNTLNISSGGVLVTSNVTGPVSILGGYLTSEAGEFVFINDSTQKLTVTSVLDGEYALIKSGVGTVELAGINNLTGSTAIHAGLLIANGLGDDGSLTLSDFQTSSLQINANETVGSLSGGNSTVGSIYGSINVGGNALTIRQHESATYAGVFVGNGTIVKDIAGTQLNLTGNSTDFTGAIVVNAGILRLSTISGMAYNATSYTVNKSGSLYVDSYPPTPGTLNPHRLNDNASITLNSADGTFVGETVVRGLGIRTSGDVAAYEDFGTLTFGSGASYLTLTPHVRGQSQAATVFDAAEIERENNATFNIRGMNLGYSGPNEARRRRSLFRFDVTLINSTTGAETVIDTSKQAAFVAANLVGGNGAAGTTTMSILPWAIGENVASFDDPGIDVTDTNMGNSLLTYVTTNIQTSIRMLNEVAGSGAVNLSNTPTGFRPLDFDTEYDTFATSVEMSNVRESLTSDLIDLDGRTINALVLHNNSVGPATIQVLGAGSGQGLALNSGALLFTLNPAGVPGEFATILGGFDDGISVVSRDEFVIHVVNPNSADPTLNLTATISSPLVSIADITKSGRGTLVLSGVNTSGGGSRRTTINEGILRITDLDNIGGNSGALVFAGGMLQLGSGFSDDLSTRTLNVLTGGGTLDTAGLNAMFAFGLGDLTPVASDTFTKIGDGLMTLQGSSTFIGTFVAGHSQSGTAADGNAMVLLLNGDPNAALSGNLQIGSSVLPTGNFRAAVALGADEQIANTATISFNGAVDKEAYFKLMGFTETVAGISDATGYGIIENLEGSESGVTTDGKLILNGATNFAFSGVIRDKGTGSNTTKLSLEKQGSGVQTLSGPNTFTGDVVLDGGVLYLRSAEVANTSGPLGVGGTISFGGGTLRYSSLNSHDYSNRFSTAAGQAISIDTNGRTVTFNTPLTSVGGSLSKTGPGTLILNATNTYNGGTTINGGVLQLSNATALGSGAVTMSGVGSTLRLNGSDVTLAGLSAPLFGPIVENGHASTPAKVTINLASGGDTFFGALQNGGAAALSLEKIGGGTLVLAGANTYSGLTTISLGTLQIGAGGTTGTLGSAAVTNNATLTFNRTDNYGGNVANAISGSGNVNVQAGQLTLTAVNSYAGLTNVNGGQLYVTGSLASSTVNVANNATLGGGGSISGTVSVQSGGAVAPGVGGIGTLTVGGLSLVNGSVFNFEFGTGNDLIHVLNSNGLVLNGGGFNLYEAGTPNAFTENGTFNLIQYSGTLGGLGTGALSVLNPSTERMYTFDTAGGYVTLNIKDAPGNYWAPAVGGGSGAASTWTANSSTWSPTPGRQGSGTQKTTGALVFTDNAGTVTVSGTVATGEGLTFASNNYLLTGGQINLTGSAASNTITVEDSMSAQIASSLNVSTGITKAGGGTLVLSGTNTLASVAVDAGTFQVASSGSLSASADVAVAGGATAGFANSPSLGTVVADGSVNFTGASASIITLGGAIGGHVDLAAGTTLTVDAGTFNGTLSGNSSSHLIKETGGTLALDGTNTNFLGTTTVNEGTLSVSTPFGGAVTVNGGNFIVQDGGSVGGTITVGGNGAPATFRLEGDVNGTVVVADQGVLGGSGTAGAAKVLSGGTLSPGNSIAELEITGNGAANNEALLQINGGATIIFEFLDAAGTPGTGWDFVDLAAGGTLDLTGVNSSNKINLDIISWLPNNSGPGAAANFRLDTVIDYGWLFIQADALTGVSALDLNADYTQYFAINDNGVFEGDDPFERPTGPGGVPAKFGVEWRTGGPGTTGLYITFAAVPEPGSMVLAGLGSLAAAWYGKRRLRKNAAVDQAAMPELPEQVESKSAV